MISSMKSLTIMVLGPGYLVRALFKFCENSVVHVSGLFSFSRVIWIFSFSPVIGIFSFSLVNGIFSSCRVKCCRVISCQFNWKFSCSKTFLVSNSEFLIYFMYAFDSLTLSYVTSTIRCLDASQSQWSVNPFALVTGAKTGLILSAVLTVESHKSANFGVFLRMGLLVKFILLIASTSTNSMEIAS